MKRGIVAVFALVLASCSKDTDLEMMQKQSADTIFATGKKAMEEKDFGGAIKIFEELERLHPYSRLVAEAQLKAGQCHYAKKQYTEATASFEIFVKTYPTHKQVPYALYMLGLLHYEQMPIISRDQEPTIASIAYFKELCERYPTSEYVKDAQAKLFELRQQVSGREVYVARYYQDHKNYAAAIGRLNTVIDSYGDTIHEPEALHRLVECYLAMGVHNEALRVGKLLSQKYPSTNWAQHSRALLEQTRAKNSVH
jgi:outer membrane protein assembly factor BamD